MKKTKTKTDNNYRILTPCHTSKYGRHRWNIRNSFDQTKKGKICQYCHETFENVSMSRHPGKVGRPKGSPGNIGARWSKITGGIIEERKKNPCLTLQQIGDKYGVSKEYIRQVLNREGLPTKHFIQNYVCNYCEKILHRRKLFCNHICMRKYHDVQMICDYCGKTFTRKIHNIKISLRRPLGGKGQKKFFCNKSCHGKYIAENYGFSKFPDHAKYPSKNPLLSAKEMVT